MIWRAIFVLVVSLLLAVPALSVNPDEVLADPALEARARDISQHLRCLVCQNQSIDDSDADLARDLRVLVRERLTAGDTNDEVIQYVVDRYGEFVLLNPRVGWHTLLLWAAAPIVFLVGLIALLVSSRKRTLGPQEFEQEDELTEDEKKALAELRDSAD